MVKGNGIWSGGGCVQRWLPWQIDFVEKSIELNVFQEKWNDWWMMNPPWASSCIPAVRGMKVSRPGLREKWDCRGGSVGVVLLWWGCWWAKHWRWRSRWSRRPHQSPPETRVLHSHSLSFVSPELLANLLSVYQADLIVATVWRRSSFLSSPPDSRLI